MSKFKCFMFPVILFHTSDNQSRGSLGFGEEALQSLPGKIGFQVNCFIKLLYVYVDYI